MTQRLPVHAISVRQPWAWLIVQGHKDFENRSPAAMRGHRTGPIAIHASLGMTRKEYEEAKAFAAGLGVTIPAPADLQRGAIVGQTSITGKTDGHGFSRWAFGPGMGLELASPCDPIPCRGQLGRFAWSDSQQPLAQPLPWMVKYNG